MKRTFIDSSVSPYEGILDIVDEIWKTLDDFINDLPDGVYYVYFETRVKENLNKIKNYFD